MVEDQTQLVQRSDLDVTLQALKEKEQAVIDSIQKVLPHLTEAEDVHKSLQRRLEQSLGHIAALDAGYVPVSGGWFTKTDSKNKWSKAEVTRIVKTMPAEIKEAWDKGVELGIFKSFSVSGRGGDPLLVGNIGKKHFLIGAWVNFEGGHSTGFRFMGRQSV